LPLLHEELPAEELKLRVGAAQRRGEVSFAEHVLEGDWEGSGPIRAKGEKHRMRKSVMGEVGPVPSRGPSRCAPREGQSSPWIPAGEGSMIGGVAVQRRHLKRCWKPGGGCVDLRWGAHHPKAGQAVLVRKEEVMWGEAGFNGQDVGRGAGEAIRGPSLDLVPEGRELSRHVNGGFESIRAVAEDGKEERGGQLVAQERGQTHPRGGEPLYGHESSFGFSQSLGKVWGRGDGGGEPVSQPTDHVLGGKSPPV